MIEMNVELDLVWDTRCEVSESPVWDEGSGRIFFIDMYGRRLLAFGVADGRKESWSLPDKIGSIGLCHSGRMIVALRRSVVFLDLATGALTPLTGDVSELGVDKFNDGKVGPDGCFWVGSSNQASNRTPTGRLYRITPDGRYEVKARDFIASNGLAWSPDGRTMYHSDSNRCFIRAWDFDRASGQLSNERRFAEVTVQIGKPDGAACDMDGFYWSAGATGGSLNKFAPDGELVERHLLPIPAPTMLCFAGSSVFVTSLRKGRSEAMLRGHPTLGGLFRMAAPAVGAPIAKFADI